MLDFGTLPPELNSARMYAGQGSTPMMAAASAWASLAAELESAATGYQRIITQLGSEAWAGAAAMRMVEAAAPYLAWMTATAVQAEQAAVHTRAAADAFETAFTATVPPPLIAANRTQWAQALSTNVIGQNTPLITQLEAEYGQMWAQDAAAMYGYAGRGATLADVAPFTAPAENTNPAGAAMQAAAVSRAAAGAGADSTQRQFLSSVPHALHSLAAPGTTGTDALPPISDVLETNPVLDAWASYVGPTQNSLAMIYRATGMSTHFLSLSKAVAPAAKAAIDGAKAATGLPGLSGILGGLSGGAGVPVAAGLGAATPIGGLSAPPAWAAAAGPAIASASPIPVSHIAAAAAPEAAGAGQVLGGAPLAGLGSNTAGNAGARYGMRLAAVMLRPPCAG